MSAFVINPYRFASAAGISDFAYLDGYQDTSNTSVYTYSAIDLGAADANRYIYVAFGQRATSSLTVSSATIGGQSATLEVQQSSGNNDAVCIFSAQVPTGATGDIVITLSGTAVRSGIGVYRVIGSPATVDFGGGSDLSATSVTLSTQAGGYIIAAAVKRGVNNFIWTNVTENDELALEGAMASFSTASESTDGTSVTVQCSNTGPYNHGMCCISIG